MTVANAIELGRMIWQKGIGWTGDSRLLKNIKMIRRNYIMVRDEAMSYLKAILEEE